MVYQKYGIFGVPVGVIDLERKNTSFNIPQPGESEAPYLENPDYVKYKEDVAKGVQVLELVTPLSYSEYEDINPVRLVTSNATPTELIKWTLAPRTLYIAQLELESINLTAANAPCRHMESTITAKRINAGAVLVGAPVVKVDQVDAPDPLPVTPAVSGNNFIIRVTGRANQDIHWHLSGRLKVISYEGRTGQGPGR